MLAAAAGLSVFAFPAPPALAKAGNAIKLRILGYQHNKEFNDAVNYWRQIILTKDASQKTYEYPPACGSAFRFLIRNVPVFAEILGSRGMPAISIQPRIRPFLKQRGIEIVEP